MLEVNADLVFASGEQNDTHVREWLVLTVEALQGDDVSFRWSAGFNDGVFDRDGGMHILAKRRADGEAVAREMSVDDGLVVLFDLAMLPKFAQLSGGFDFLGDKGNSAGFAVQAIDQVGDGAGAEIKAHP